ncbi:unnamed protein product [Trichobilharzia szidati]|nr:unnamed protein product [Trichobilharzia szidati]
MIPACPSVETGSVLLVRSRRKPYIDPLLFDYFPKKYAPQSGKSLVGVFQPYSCECSGFIYSILMQCVLPKDFNGFQLNGYNTHCLLIDCGGRFCASQFTDFVKSHLQNKIPTSKFENSQYELLISEMLSRIHILRVFTDCELLLSVYVSREVIKVHPVSCLIISAVNAFSHLERLRCTSWRNLSNHHSILMGVLLRLVVDFQLLCIATMRHFPDAYLSKGCDPNSSLNSEAHEILRPSVLPFTEAKPDDWLKYVTHKVELFDCQNSFVSYIKDESGMKVIKDTRVSNS